MYRYNSDASSFNLTSKPRGRGPAGLRFIFDALALWQDRRRQRLALARLDNRLLRDIGLSSADVDHEISKPFWR